LENSLLQARRITCEVDRRFASFASSLPSPLPPALPSPQGTLSSDVTDNGGRDGKEGEDQEVGKRGRKEEMQISLDRLGRRIRLFAAQALGDAWRGYQVGKEGEMMRGGEGDWEQEEGRKRRHISIYVGS
jgi:hypothetical protein